MTDAAPDKEKRKHGAMWYVTAELIVYVTGYPLAIVLTERLIDLGVVSRRTRPIVEILFYPVLTMVSAIGVRDEFEAFLKR